MLIGKTEFNISPKRRAKSEISPKLLSFPSESVSPINNLNIKQKPLNNNHSDLSFKGSFLYTAANNGNKYLKDELLAFTKKHLGHMGEDLYNHVAKSDLEIAKKMFKVDSETGEIIFHKKSIPHLIRDGLILKNLPTDIYNGAILLLGKVKPLENWAQKHYNSQSLKKLRAESKIEAQISALRGLAETRAKLVAQGKSEEDA